LAAKVAAASGESKSRSTKTRGRDELKSGEEIIVMRVYVNGVESGAVEELDWRRFVGLSDPDGNRWALQQIVHLDA
jgi:hypothetical protein